MVNQCLYSMIHTEFKLLCRKFKHTEGDFPTILRCEDIRSVSEISNVLIFDFDMDESGRPSRSSGVKEACGLADTPHKKSRIS
jgi:hypothetical protein